MDEERCLDLCIEVANRTGIALGLLARVTRNLDEQAVVRVLQNLEDVPASVLPRVRGLRCLPSEAQGHR